MSFHTFFSTRVNKTDEARKIVTQKTLCNQRGCSVYVAFLSTVVVWGIVKYVLLFFNLPKIQKGDPYKMSNINVVPSC